jgi:hypothetical protein
VTKESDAAVPVEPCTVLWAATIHGALSSPRKRSFHISRKQDIDAPLLADWVIIRSVVGRSADWYIPVRPYQR